MNEPARRDREDAKPALRRLFPSRESLPRACASALAFAAVAAVVAASCSDGGEIGRLAEACTRPDAAALARTARLLVRGAAACAIGAAAALLAVPRLRRPAPAFLLLALLVGPFYLFALTPFAVPDEPFHYRQALSRAAPLAGLSECDAAFALEPLARFQHRNRPEGYAFLGGGTGAAPGGAGDPIRPAEWARKGNALLWLPQTAGAAFALRAGFGPRGVFYLGRAAALAFYALCVFLAIRLAPAFRRAIAAAALCPIALQQAASFSYDCAALSAGFLCFALFLRLASEKTPLPRPAAWAALAAAGLGAAVKGAAAPFLPLLAAVPAARFPRGRAGKAVFLALAAGVAAAALAASATILPGVVYDRTPGTVSGGAPAHALGPLLANPALAARILLRTFDFDAVQLFLDSFGSRMAGLTLRLPAHVTLAFAAAVLLSVRGDRSLPRAGAVRAASAAGVAALTLYLCLVMLLSDTPAWAGNIWNLQGRYWTPVLPALLCAFFAREPAPDSGAPPREPSRLLFPALALLHLDAVVFLVRSTLAS